MDNEMSLTDCGVFIAGISAGPFLGIAVISVLEDNHEESRKYRQMAILLLVMFAVGLIAIILGRIYGH